MKKVFTILFISVVLLSGTTLRYSAHYCQGAFIAARLSLSGENASCGMNQEKSENKNVQFSDLMCVNEITSCTFSSNYVFTPQLQDAVKYLPVAGLPVVIVPKLIPAPAASLAVNTFPPGPPVPLRSESEVLCVFRI